jgi:hypothetical protein
LNFSKSDKISIFQAVAYFIQACDNTFRFLKIKMRLLFFIINIKSSYL